MGPRENLTIFVYPQFHKVLGAPRNYVLYIKCLTKNVKLLLTDKYSTERAVCYSLLRYNNQCLLSFVKCKVCYVKSLGAASMEQPCDMNIA